MFTLFLESKERVFTGIPKLHSPLDTIYSSLQNMFLLLAVLIAMSSILDTPRARLNISIISYHSFFYLLLLHRKFQFLAYG